MSFTGVFTGLISAGMEFVIIMMMIGIISLAGVVVNNAIVLVDYTKLLITRKELELGVSGERKDRLTVPYVIEAIIEAAERAYFLTALCRFSIGCGRLPPSISASAGRWPPNTSVAVATMDPSLRWPCGPIRSIRLPGQSHR